MEFSEQYMLHIPFDYQEQEYFTFFTRESQMETVIHKFIALNSLLFDLLNKTSLPDLFSITSACEFYCL